jgi:hypothetical protein
LTSLSVSGTSAINTTAVTTSGAQTYTGAATLGADTTLTGAGITLGSTLQSDGTARSLSINDSATTTFNGAVGGTGATAQTASGLPALPPTQWARPPSTAAACAPVVHKPMAMRSRWAQAPP